MPARRRTYGWDGRRVQRVAPGWLQRAIDDASARHTASITAIEEIVDAHNPLLDTLCGPYGRLMVDESGV